MSFVSVLHDIKLDVCLIRGFSLFLFLLLIFVFLSRVRCSLTMMFDRSFSLTMLLDLSCFEFDLLLFQASSDDSLFVKKYNS